MWIERDVQRGDNYLGRFCCGEGLALKKIVLGFVLVLQITRGSFLPTEPISIDNAYVNVTAIVGAVGNRLASVNTRLDKLACIFDCFIQCDRFNRRAAFP